MPFTPAHVAAVLPLRGRAGLPLAALAAGSMSPDLPYFLPFSLPRSVTHSVGGIPTWDLAFGLAMWLVWRWTMPALHDVAPAPIRQRWQPSPTPGTWWSIPLAVLIGAATHLVWDSFTHPGDFSRRIPWLAATYPSPLGPLAGHSYLQYASGVLGIAALFWVGLRQSILTSAPRQQPRTAAITPALALAGAFLGVAVRLALRGMPDDRHLLAYVSVTSAISGAGLALAGVCVFHALVAQSQDARAGNQRAM